MNSLDLQLQLNAAATLTATGLLTNVLNQSVITGHVENQLDPVGLFIPYSSVKVSGTTETYQFQVLSDSASNLTTTPIVVADTGVMTDTDARLTSGMGYIFLMIQWGTVLQQYVGAKFFGANTPSLVIGGAWFAPLSAVQNFLGFPINYTP